MHVEHIDPGKGDDPDNLCLSCPSCNLSKGTAVSAIDPDTGNLVSLFNPRYDRWKEHLEWIDDGTLIRGISATGRATIVRLKMNQDRIVRARRNWIISGGHPPK
jgi:hypothetical protein